MDNIFQTEIFGIEEINFGNFVRVRHGVRIRKAEIILKHFTIRNDILTLCSDRKLKGMERVW